MNFLALTGQGYENNARGILYVIYEMMWKLIYHVLNLIDVITNLFYRIAGINISDGVVENRNIFDQLLSQNIVGVWYGLFMAVAAALVIIFTIIAIIRSMSTDDERKKSVAPIIRNIGLALLLLLVTGPIILLLISLISNIAIIISSLGGKNSISIADILFNNSGNLLVVYNETHGTEITSFRDMGNDFLYDLIYNPSTAEGATKLTFYWYIALLGGVFVLYNLIVIVVEIVKRIFNIVVLYVASPFAISKIALDDGKSFKAWQNKFFYEFLLIITQIGTFMLFAALVNVLSNITFSAPVAAVETEPSLIEGGESAVVVDDGEYHLIDGLGRTLIIMAAVSVTRSSAKMLAELLTSKESKTEGLLESVLNKISTRGSNPVLKTRTITKTTSTSRKETVFVEPTPASTRGQASGNTNAASSTGGTRNISQNVNMNVTQNFTTNNKYNSTNNITNRVVRDNIKQGSYSGEKVSPSTVYVNTTRIVQQPAPSGTTFKFMDEATKKAASTAVKEYDKASSSLKSAISAGDSAKLKQTFNDYTKAYNKEAEALSKNYRQFETKANASMKSNLAAQTKEELKNISQAYRKAQIDYNRTADKLKQYEGERMSTADALKVKEKADKQRETLMSASNRAAQFYENQKKGE